jgi:IS4 transposase
MWGFAADFIKVAMKSAWLVCGSLTVRPPYRADRDLPPVTVNLVLVEETNAPEGCEPIRWILATTLPIDNEEEVQMIIESYCQRWQIEIFFKTLKSGCNIEKRLFEQLPHVLNCLAVCLIIAWRASVGTSNVAIRDPAPGRCG